MSSKLPGVVALAKLAAPTKSKQQRLLEVLQPLHDHCKAHEPQTASFYTFKSRYEDDHALSSFEAYEDMSALTDVHAKSDAMKEVGARNKAEELCSMEFDLLTPVDGFLLRPGQSQQPAEMVVVNKFNTGAAEEEDRQTDLSSQLTAYARHVFEKEEDGCSTFVLLKPKKGTGMWTFERYHTDRFYHGDHCGSTSFKDLTGSFEPSTEIYREAGVGFVQK